ncbi:LysR family transcriptional regulator [Pectinatus haikarae]|uniref:DNA-binding transcriptional LysR family regulator n=1 Tax=Pectinatus haikarae TaxID=349096 RepID=A0ABT9Y761_9FIRM|nr:LysR family transcriptional regulator [Pectinatus haikarae]MDQ0203662.1 DNA-binding transcriptional LysR family regulator [Pectinatus haikarae]
MEDRDWQIIQRIYIEKNITKAAQALYMSQPALTARLQHIEREFNVRIVHRSTRGIQFTPEGEYLVEKAAQMTDQMRHIKNEVQELFSENAGTLEIGASNYLTMYVLPVLLEQFKKKYPAVKYRVVTSWSKNIFTLLYNQKIQVGFASIDYGGCKNKHLMFEEPVYMVYREPFAMSDLPELPRIEYDSDYLLKGQLDKWWRENFKKPPQVSMHVSNLENCKRMVVHGLGYAPLPAHIIREHNDILHRLTIVEKSGDPITRKTWMIHSDLNNDMPIVKLFVDFVKEYTL